MKRILLVLASVIGFQNLAVAELPVPPDLNPGDKYHLVFNSSSLRQATATLITDYDAFVQQIADLEGFGEFIKWRAIASTATINARDHAVIGENTPVYNMNLQKVANGFADFWDGSHSANMAWDESGNSNLSDVWTGTLPNGTKADGLFLGGNTAWCGNPSAVNVQWTNNITVPTSTLLSLYGISEELVVLAGNGVAINAGHGGNWWNGPARSGEGAQIEVADGGGGDLVFVATVYSYGPAGGQIFLIAVGTPDGGAVEVDVFITDGAVWGDGFDPNDVTETQWGTGVFTAESCDLINMSLTPTLAMQTLGYTNLSYNLVRLTTPKVACPLE